LFLTLIALSCIASDEFSKVAFKDVKINYDILIGKGGFGEVFEGQIKQFPGKFAVKTVNVKYEESQLLGMIKNEKEILIQIRNKKCKDLIIVKTELTEYSPIYTKYIYYFVFDFFESDLRKYIKSLASMNNISKYSKIVHIVHRTLNGLSELNAMNYIHRDIKPENILVDHLGNPKIADFGLTISKNAKSKDIAGTLVYFAPEMIKSNPIYDEKIDIWALGIVFRELATNQHPFRFASRITDLQFLHNKFYQEEKLPFELPDEVVNIEEMVYKYMLVPVESRKTADWLLAHYFKK